MEEKYFLSTVAYRLLNEKKLEQLLKKNLTLLLSLVMELSPLALILGIYTMLYSQVLVSLV